MKYLDKLFDQFPDTPRRIIVKADISRRGIKPTPTLFKIGAKSSQTGLATKLQKVILKVTELPPEKFHFKSDKTTVDIRVHETSPYQVKEDSDGKYHLFCDTENFGEVTFTKRSSYTDKTTSDGQECSYLVTQRGPHCLCVSVLDICAYIKKDEHCRYCIVSPGMEVGLKEKLIKAVPDPEMIAEALEIACEDVELKELKISGGGLYNTHKEATYYKKFLEAAFNRIDPPEEVTVMPQAFDKEDAKDLKELGATNICYNMEVWHERIWPLAMPGKTKAVGRDQWIKRLEDAVEIFGRGHVGTNFVGGFECAPRPGYLSQNEALESSFEGYEFLIKRGIIPWFSIWNAHPFVGGFSVDDPPSTEFYLQMGEKIHELLQTYDAYLDLGFPKMGMDPPTLGLYCYYCYNFQFTRDYPRLINRE